MRPSLRRTCRARSRGPSSNWSAQRSWPQCASYRRGSGKHSCCGTTGTSQKPRSPRSWGPAGQRLIITPSGPLPHCRPSWKSRREEGREGYKGAGAGRMTSEDRDYEASIRHALHATAESIDPAGDGLERIRHRVASPRPATSLPSSLVAWFRRAAIKLLVRLEPGAWLWPVLAIAGAAAIVVAGIFALSEVQQSITQANSVSPPGTTHHPVRASPPTQMALGAWALPIGVEPSPTTGSLSGASSTDVLPVSPPRPPASAPPPGPSPPAPTATARPSPTATATPTPTLTPTPTATPTPTVTSTP